MTQRDHRQGWHARRLAALAAAACIAAFAGCGYSTQALIRDDIRTVHIPVFNNRTWFRGLEVELTNAVLDEVKLHTRLIIASRQNADSTLEGELLEVKSEALTKTEQDMVVLRGVTVEVRFRWVDNLTGRQIAPWQTVVESTTVGGMPGDPLAERPFAEVAQRIVERMEKDW